MGEPSFVTYKILVDGPFSSGKTSFIRAISEIDVVSTEKSVPKTSKDARGKENIIVALDFGRITSRDDTVILYMFGTPGARRFDFMWETLAEGILGCVFMVDSRKPETFREVVSRLRIFRAYSPLPIVVAANKQDLPEAWDVDALRIALRLPDDIPIIPCVATDRESVKGVMIALLNEVLKAIEIDIDEEAYD